MGDNYASLYISGKNYEWIRDLDRDEYREFIQGVLDGFQENLETA